MSTSLAVKAGVLMAALSSYVFIAVRWGWVAVAVTFAASVVLGLAITALGDWRDERVRRQIRRRQDEMRAVR